MNVGMSKGERTEGPTAFRLGPLSRGVRLSRSERIALIAVVVGLLIYDIVRPFWVTETNVASAIFEGGITAACLLFVRWPRVAALAVLALVPIGLAVHAAQVTAMTLSIVVGLVIRTGSGGMIAVFALGMLVTFGLASAELAAVDPTALGTVLLITAACSAVGMVSRLAFARERRLRSSLRDRDLARLEVRKTERQRIADDLHDVIGHDLTVIAMHARAVEYARDDETRAASIVAIGDAARKALTDLRRVVGTTELRDADELASPAGLPGAIADASRELLAVGMPLCVTGDPTDPRISRLISGALARVLRESTTNVLKHGSPGPVDLHIDCADQTVTMTVTSRMRLNHNLAPLPSGGYGTVRMQERAEQLGGTFRSGRDGDTWCTSVELPLA